MTIRPLRTIFRTITRDKLISALASEVVGSAPSSSAIPSVIYDGVTDHLKHTAGPSGVSNGATLTFAWEGEFQSDGSAMTLLDIPGTVPVKITRQSDNTIDFVGGTSGAVFSNSTAAVAASLGRLIILASCNGTSSTLKVVHASGTITGTNTPGSATDLDLTADWYLGSDGGAAEFLDAYTGMWWVDDAEIDFTDTENIEDFWDTTNDKLRDPGSDGSNPGGDQPLICHADHSADHTTNRGSGGDADAGSNSGDATSPGSYSGDYTPVAPSTSITLTDQGFDNTNSSTHTISGVSLGTAEAGRFIAVTLHAYTNTASPNLNGVTIGGVSATIIGKGEAANGNLRTSASIAIAAVPTGTTGDVVVSWAASHFNCHVTVHKILGIDGVTASDSGTSAEVDPLTDTLTTTTGGINLVAASSDSTAATAAFTGVTEVVDEADDEGRQRVAVGSGVQGAGGSTAFTCEFTTATSFDAAVFAHWAAA